ncbi:putative forkhead domain-containing protein [Phaeomoniella chlamydospora]|uniref:Putative forkhead domain-containing protein n=1 Tax=Phaeomoniella chlamydospora TaxID=158046 RepID=A0A0G2E483_PHACM|nr:putative forkhead domain-containing protein [Phaeomoniella chlamydospora]
MATSMVGRQGLSDPIDLHGGHFTDGEDNDSGPDSSLQPTRTNETTSSNDQDDDQAKRRAVNNLLAQLMPNKASATEEPAQTRQHKESDESAKDRTQVSEQEIELSQGDSLSKPAETLQKSLEKDISGTADEQENPENGDSALPAEVNGLMHAVDTQQAEIAPVQNGFDASVLTGIDASAALNGDALSLQVSQDQDMLSQPLNAESLHALHSLAPAFDPSNLDYAPEDLPSPSEGLQREDIPDHMRKPAERGQIEAFAKLEFQDGNYYITTHSCELGRDVLALRAAEARERSSSGHLHHKSSSGKASHLAHRVKRDESGIVGSVVSERGGFCGVDDNQEEPPEEKPHSSNGAGSDIIKPEDMHLNIVKKPYDYAAGAVVLAEDEQPRPVDPKALLPSPDQNPLIPIHPTAGQDGAEEIAAHKSISRRHVRIAWNFQQNYFELIILGRNGAFLNGRWHAQGVALPLDHGAQIQIGGVEVKFKLPTAPAHDDIPALEDSLVDDEEMQLEADDDEDVKDSIENDDQDSKPKSGPRLKLVTKKKLDSQTPSQPLAGPVDPANPQIPAKRRGPGRPPKDGIMSNRERREIEKAKKLAALREANGGVTPPPSGRQKIVKPKEPEDPDAPKTEKRKYTKRKRPDGTPAEGEGNGEGGSAEPGSDDESKPTKRAREEKSPSPVYPPESTFTEEQLAKPPYNYTVLIFEALQESPKPLTLRNIYRALKLKYPYFVYRCPTDGWQSSVRHNLNGDRNLFEHAERDGKGWSWRVVPGATMEKEKKRKPEPIERPDQSQPRYPPPGARPPGQPFGGPYSPYPQYPPGAPPPPGMPYFPPQNMPPGQYPPPGTPASYGFPGQPPQQPMPPPQHGSPGSAPPPNASSPTVQSGMGILKPSPAPAAPQPPHPPTAQQPPNRQAQPSPQNRPPGQTPNNLHPSQPQPLQLDPMLPCTPEGLFTIQNFEYAIYADTPDREERKRLQDAFGSVRARVLGGRKQSILPGGETKHEQVLLGHVKKIVERFPNPIYNADMVKRREAERERVEAETRAKAAQGQNGQGSRGPPNPNPGAPTSGAGVAPPPPPPPPPQVASPANGLPNPPQVNPRLAPGPPSGATSPAPEPASTALAGVQESQGAAKEAKQDQNKTSSTIALHAPPASEAEPKQEEEKEDVQRE